MAADVDLDVESAAPTVVDELVDNASVAVARAAAVEARAVEPEARAAAAAWTDAELEPGIAAGMEV